MADEKNTNPADQVEDDIYDEGEFEDDGTADIIREIINKAEDEDGTEDDGGFDQPMEEPKVEGDQTVTAEEGHNLIDEADRKRSTRGVEKTEAKADEKADEKGASGEKKAEEADAAKAEDGKDPKDGEGEEEGKEVKPDDPQTDLQTAAIDDLLDGVPDERKGEVSRRLKEADAALAPFQSEYVQQQLQQHGATPAEVATRLTELAQFAQEKPDEYIAWAATEMSASPEKIGDVLGAAAKLLGYKVVKEDAPAEEDDDPFMSDRERELLKENRELRAKQDSTERSFGPDAPERRQVREFQTQMENFVNEVDETGEKKRPLFDHFQPVISARATKMHQDTGKPVTFEDLGKIYDDVVEQTRSQLGAPAPTPAASGETSAAKQTSTVASEKERKAAAAKKAQLASKSVDGSGQGASRRLALPDTDDPTDVIRALVSQASG